MSRHFLFALPLAALFLLSCEGGLEVTPAGGAEQVATRWLELSQAPAGLALYSRRCDLNGKDVRNYTFCYDPVARVSRWVAYPLYGAFMGSSGRSEAWGLDPLLPAAQQPDVSRAYREGNHGWYARGHQLPSGDRTASYTINATTFYGTNITPQDYDFNAGVWAVLEGKVRDWARSSDTLYVVTGCVPDGSPYFVNDASGASVSIPKAYFKAVLRYKKDSTLGRSGYMAAAFWYDHSAPPATFSSAQALSVAALEQKLGYALFSPLSDKVGAGAADAIKTENPATVNWWWQ